MSIKTVPNQKVVTIQKEDCGKGNLYAAINLEAMQEAAVNLDAGAFKLWIYFAKNQNNYCFALSSKDAGENFGLKKKQYNNAIENLIKGGYLIQKENNHYDFNEVPVVSKSNNVVVSKGNNAVVSKSNNVLLPKDTRNNTDTTLDNTLNNTGELSHDNSLNKTYYVKNPSSSKDEFVF